MGTLYYGDNLDMMFSRLVELRRVLKPTASHYLKLLCEALFGWDETLFQFTK